MAINGQPPIAPETPEAQKQLDLDRKQGIQNYLRTNGIDLNAIKPKMEEYSSLLQWNKDSIAYQLAKVEALKKAAELYNTIGGNNAQMMTEIMRISYFLDMMEKKMLEEGENPLESKEYLNALKLKKELLVEYNKLNLDYNKAAVDYKFKKALRPDMDDGFTVINADEVEKNDTD